MTLPFSVLVTRPSPHGEALCEELKQHDFHPVFLPVIEIKPLVTPSLKQQIKHLDEYTCAIFLSRHAVAISAALIKKAWPEFPQNVKVVAVGEGTARALQEAGLPLAICPEQWNTEGLLDLLELQEVSGQKIALFCGKDGRETLAEVLKERGAKVTSFVSYERVLPRVKMKPFYTMLAKNKLDAVVCTSGSGVYFLKQLFSPSQPWAALRKIPLVLVSERIMIQAKEQGFESCVLAKNASHEGILQALQKIRNKSMSAKKTHATTPPCVDSIDTAVLSPKPRRFCWSIIMGFCGIVIAGLAGAYFLNQTMQSSLTSAAQQLQSDREQIAQLQDKIAGVQHDLQLQQETLVQQSKALANDQQAKNLSNILAAQHWVQLGNELFLLTANVPRTLNFLSQAQNELDRVTDPQIVSIKQALAEDIATLKNIVWVNPADLYISLVSLQKQVLQLPIMLVPSQEVQSSTLPPLAASEAVWRQGLHNTWEVLRKMIVVHKLPAANTPPFIMPDQHPYIYQNLYAILNEAMWAVLHQDADIYHASLKQAEEWINQYFLLSSQLTQNALSEIAKLQSVSLHTAKAVTLTAPKAFQDYLKNS